MAIEGAAVLGGLLSRISHLSQLKPLLEAYQELRHPRATMAQESSRLNRHTFNLPDGSKQRERDENMRKAMALQLSGSLGVPQRDSAADLKKSDERRADAIFAYDADAEVEKWWGVHGKGFQMRVEGKL